MEPFDWVGDLEDDCCCQWGDFFAHCECMSRYDPNDPDSGDSWFAAVYRNDAAEDEDDTFNSASDDIHPVSGEAARKLCEWVMTAEAARGNR